jgi:predicted methyltransferase
MRYRLSPAVGTGGKVYAVDTDSKVADALPRRLVDSRITNVQVVVGTDDDPLLPPNALDGVIILNAYHEMPKGPEMLRRIYLALKAGAHLVLCEPVPATVGQSRTAQMDDHVLDPELILYDLQKANFQVLDRQDNFATNLGGAHFGLVIAKRP